MNIELFAVLFGLVGNLLLALLVITKNARSASNRLFCYLAIILAVEPLINYFSLHDVRHLLFIRIVMVLAVALGFVFYWLATVFPNPVIKLTGARWLELGAAAGAAVLVVSPALFSGVVVNGQNISPVTRPGMAGFIAFFGYCTVRGLAALIKRVRSERGLAKTQLRYLLLGASVMFGLIVISNLIMPVVLHSSVAVGLTPIYMLVFTGLITVAIVRHRLFTIRLIIARSVSYALLIGVLAGLYAAAAYGITILFFSSAGISVARVGINSLLAVGLAITFQPLRRYIERVTDKIFFRDRYDSQAVLNQLSTVLVSEMNLDRVLHDSLHAICRELHIGFGQFMVFKDGRIYKVEHFGPLPDRLMIVPNLLKLDHNILVVDELPNGERKQVMESHGIRLSARLRTRDELVGFLLLGDKLSGDIYSSQDIELLQIAAKELAVAISNARAYEEIREFNATLQERVKHATTRLRTANRHLKELDKAKDEFISMASHQLRTPLTTIKGYLSMILEGDTGKITDTQREFIQHSFEGSERMVSLISDLLNVSRLSAGRFLIEQKPTDVVAMIADEIRQLMPHATAKNLFLKFEPPKEVVPPVDLDENKTRQVIMNFIDNAIYYTQTGGVTVRLKIHDGHFRVEVSDTGIGVPEDAKKHLFTKFFRAGNAQNVRPDGTGLGLYLARRVVEDQGGTIIFESSEGQGSTFGFELPIKGSPAHAAVPAPQPEEKVPAHV